MPETPNIHATERSPLLANHTEESERPTPKSHDSQNGSPNDVESNEQTEETEDPAIVEGRKKVKTFLPILGVGIFLAFLDQSIVAAINGEMGSDLHALKNVSWIATAYFLTMTASQPLYGKLSDIFGRKPCLLFAYTMFGVGSLGCGVTGSMGGLIAARVGTFIDHICADWGLKASGYPRHWRWWHVDCCHRSFLRLHPAKGTGLVSSLPQSDWSSRLNFWWPYWSDINPNAFPSNRRLTFISKVGFLYKVLAGDGKQDLLTSRKLG